MMKFEFKTLEEVKNNFKWSDRWKIFDKDRENLNIAYECVDRHPKDKTAIRLRYSDGRTEIYTYDEISRWSSQFANMLKKRGINPGDRVALLLNQSLAYYVSFFGTLKRGAVAVPCYSLLGPDGIEYRLKDSEAKMAIVHKDRMDVLPSGLVSHIVTSEEILDLIKDEDEHYETNTSYDTLAVVQFTSGTTGQPKQILYKHAAMSITGIMIRLMIGIRDDDRYMCPSSPAWGHGVWYGTVGPMIYGTGICAYSGKFDAEAFLKTMEDFEITIMSAIPRVYKMIMNCGKIDNYNLKLRQLSYTGGAMDKEVVQYFLDKTGVYILSGYGNTESGPVALDYPFEDWKPRLGSAGKAMLGVKLGILDDNGNELPPGEIGEVAIWRNEQWRMIGDSGYLDEDGYLFPKGRSDDVIKSSGYRIGPFEVESALMEHPAVLETAITGVPDPVRGQVVKASIVLAKGYTASDELKVELQEHVKSVTAPYKYPRVVEFVIELPKTISGKIRRVEIRENSQNDQS